jgi:two-component system chemotaxis response regulator CheB
MPNMKGTDFLKKLIPVNPLPVVLVSSLDIGAFEALHAGAVDFVKKPDIKSENEFVAFCNELSVKIKVASYANIKKVMLPGNPLPKSKLKINKSSQHVIAIGASTGGTEATANILVQLPADIPGIVIVQHMPAGFTKMYADRLDKMCKFSVSEAKSGDRVEKGKALIAAGGKHMMLKKDQIGYYVRCMEGEKVSGHCPSVNVLFHSVAIAAGDDSIGIILTGMGRDGAEGLLDMKKNGAFTIGQDKQSSVVYGMPMEAYKVGAVHKQVACQNIAATIVERLNQ